MAALIIAHRGGAPEFEENSRAAFESGIENGADMLEVDVLQTADGVLVARHDQLAGLPAGGHLRVSEAPFDLLQQTLPTLMSFEEYLERFGTLMRTNVDVKASGFERQLVRMLRRFDVTDNVVVSSTLGRSLRQIKFLAPEVTCGLSRGQLVPWLGREPHSTVAAELLRPTLPLQLPLHGRYALAGAFMLNYRLITPWLVRSLHRSGFQVYCWTVNDPDVARELDEAGVEGIATDYPALITSALGRTPSTANTRGSQ